MPLKHTVQEVELKNGAKGAIIHVPDASVFTYELNFRAGNSYVRSPKVQQTAHILEHLAFNGTKNYPSAEKFSQVFTENGAYNNASTAEIGISYYGGSAAFEAERILGLQVEALADPLFNEKSLIKEKGTVREELTGQLSNYHRLLWSHVNKAMGGDAFTDTQKIETIDNITLKDIKEHYKRTHTTKNMRFLLGGDFNAECSKKMLAELESLDLPAGEAFAVKQAHLKKADGPIRIRKSQVDNIYLQLTMSLNRELTLHEVYVMRAVVHILTATLHSRIFGKAREEGICYYISSGSSRSADGTSEFQFMSQATPENAMRLYDLIIKELNDVAKNGVTAEELAAVKRFSLGEYQLFGQTVAALSNFYSSVFYDDPLLLMSEVAPIIESITIQDISKITEEFISSGVWGFGELGAVTAKESKKAYDKFSTQLFNRSKM